MTYLINMKNEYDEDGNTSGRNFMKLIGNSCYG